MATTLTRWDPVNELANLRSVMDRLFDPARSRFSGGRSNEEFGPVNLGLDVYETDADYVIRAAVPGVDPTDVEISVDDEVLTIKGESRHENEVTEENYLRKELSVARSSAASACRRPSMPKRPRLTSTTGCSS